VDVRGLRILLVDDHELVRAGIAMMLNVLDSVDAVYETASGAESIDLVREHQIDLVFMDIRLSSGIDGVTAALRLLQVTPDVKIVMLTAMPGDTLPGLLLNAGVKGYLSKSAPADEVAEAVAVVSQGGTYLSERIARQIALSTFSQRVESPFDLLSLRELQVILLTVQGEKPQKIAELLFLSVKTVSTYKKRASEKLAVDNPIDLIRLAMEHGLIDRV
jgi:DNA-binding NarL/FixJ family response regulator